MGTHLKTLEEEVQASNQPHGPILDSQESNHQESRYLPAMELGLSVIFVQGCKSVADLVSRRSVLRKNGQYFVCLRRGHMHIPNLP